MMIRVKYLTIELRVWQLSLWKMSQNRGHREKSLAADSLGWCKLRDDDVNANPRTMRAVFSALIRISTSFPLVFQTMDRPPWSRAMTDGWTSQKSLGPRAAGTSVIRGICSAFSPASDIFSTFAVSCHATLSLSIAYVGFPAHSSGNVKLINVSPSVKREGSVSLWKE